MARFPFRESAGTNPLKGGRQGRRRKNVTT
jgi:hypothetical protein